MESRGSTKILNRFYKPFPARSSYSSKFDCPPPLGFWPLLQKALGRCTTVFNTERFYQDFKQFSTFTLAGFKIIWLGNRIPVQFLPVIQTFFRSKHSWYIQCMFTVLSKHTPDLSKSTFDNANTTEQIISRANICSSFWNLSQ